MTARSYFPVRLTLVASFFAVLAAISAAPTPARGETPREWAAEHVEELFQLYQFFHTHPELSFQEKETAARLAKELKAVGVEVTEGVGGTGVVGMLKNGKGPLVMLPRAPTSSPHAAVTGLPHAVAEKVTVGLLVPTGTITVCSVEGVTSNTST